MTQPVAQFLLANLPYLALAALVAALGVGRLARIIIFDDFPPAVWLRIWWDIHVVETNPWRKLLHCPWCLTPWLMLAALGVFVAGWFVPWLAIIWWAVLGWLAVSYVASIIIAYDEGD